MEKKYLVPVSVAMALGYVAGLAGADITAKATKPSQEKSHFAATYATSNGMITAIWESVRNVSCGAADVELEMEAGTCAVASAPCSPGTVMSMTCMPDSQTGIVVRHVIGGQWMPDATP